MPGREDIFQKSMNEGHFTYLPNYYPLKTEAELK